VIGAAPKSEAASRKEVVGTAVNDDTANVTMTDRRTDGEAPEATSIAVAVVIVPDPDLLMVTDTTDPQDGAIESAAARTGMSPSTGTATVAGTIGIEAIIAIEGDAAGMAVVAVTAVASPEARALI
jgi:hypothetical protein